LLAIFFFAWQLLQMLVKSLLASYSLLTFHFDLQVDDYDWVSSKLPTSSSFELTRAFD